MPPPVAAYFADPDEVLPRRLRALREAAGLTQAHLAVAMTVAGYKMHQTTIAKIESGERPVVVGEAVALARVIRVDLADLITEPGLHPAADELAVALAECGRLEHRAMDIRNELAATQASLEDTENQLASAREHVRALHLQIRQMVKTEDVTK